MLSSNKVLSALGGQQKKYAIFIFVLMIFSMLFAIFLTTLESLLVTKGYEPWVSFKL